MDYSRSPKFCQTDYTKTDPRSRSKKQDGNNSQTLANKSMQREKIGSADFLPLHAFVRLLQPVVILEALSLLRLLLWRMPGPARLALVADELGAITVPFFLFPRAAG